MPSRPSTLMLLLLALSMQIKDNFDDIAAEVAKNFKEDDDLKAIVEALQMTVRLTERPGSSMG